MTRARASQPNRTSLTPRFMRRSAGLAGVGVALVLAGCGGEDKGRPGLGVAQVTPVDQCALASGYTFQDIVNFDPIDGARSPHTVACANPPYCSFYFNHDKQTVSQPGVLPEGTQSCLSLVPGESTPDVGSSLLASDIVGGRCGTSKGGFHITATNIGQCYSDGRLGWGASWELKFLAADSSVQPFDASAYDGLSLWVRKGSAAGGSAIIVTVIDEENDGIDLDSPDPVQHCGCQLQPSADEPQHTRCYKDPPATVPDTAKCDAFGIAVSLTDEWTFVPALFANMKQKGFGYPAAAPLDTTKITRLQLLMMEGDWDFWLDDLAFFKSPK